MATVLGWDTETPLGFVALLANSEGRFVETDDTVALFDFLFHEGSQADYNVFWNIRFDFGAIIKRWVCSDAVRLKANHYRAIRARKTAALLDAKEFVDGDLSVADRQARTAALEEADTLESVEHFDVGKYRVLYIPKKGFRLTRTKRKRGRNSVEFFDAMGWYSTGISGAAPLDASARRYLGGEHKTAADEGIDVVELGRSREYYAAHRDAVRRYCIQDCRLTRDLFLKTVDSFERIGIPFPRQPWSRASVGREVLKVTGVLEATRERYADLAKTGHARLWEQAYAGACILTRGVGTWDDVSKWDINSAYPFPMIQFPSLEGAYLVDRDSPEFDGCFFKFYEIDLVPTPRRALRVKGSRADHLVYHVGGEPRRVCVTQYDLDAFDAWGDSYVVRDAVGVVTPSKNRPLAYMADVYRAKTAVKAAYGADSVEYLNIKTLLNGTYGILTQSRPREGRYTNFIYGAYITAWCRRELWRTSRRIERDGGTVLAYMTDGMLVTGLPTLPASSDVLGEWEVKPVGTATLFANGLYIEEGRLKRRGAPDLTPALLRAARHPWVTVTHSGPLGLKQAVLQARPQDIGVWETSSKDLVPWRMLEKSGMRVPTSLRSAPLREFFVESWYLDHRAPTEAVSPPSILEVAAEAAFEP